MVDLGVPAGDQESSKGAKQELHLSLSRPIYLRAHQRDSLKEAIRNIAKSCSKFHLSFASFATLNNDEGTRSFLTLEVGGGHLQLAEISQLMSPFLQELRQPSYYLHPRYHTSVAWILTLSPDTKKFPADLPTRLESQFSQRLREVVIDVEEMYVKIGKQVTRFGLKGQSNEGI